MARAAAFLLLLAATGCARSEGSSTPAAESQSPAAAAESAQVTSEPVPQPKSLAPRVAAVANPAAAKAHEVAQIKLDGEPLAASDLVHFVPALRGADQPPPLANFHAALRRLEGAAPADPPQKVRVAFYGASSVAADRYTGYFRHYLQSRFGDAGAGFIALVPLWRWHRHGAVQVKASKHWRIEHAQRKTGKLDGLYGLLGATAHTTNKRARTDVKSKKSASSVDAVELWFLAQPEGGTAALTVMGQSFSLDTKAEEAGPGYLSADGIESGPLTLSVRPEGDGEVRLFGATLERNASGVVVDALGIGGTRATNMVLWDEPLWRTHLQRRDPALWVLAYGANESVDEDEPIEVYRDNLAIAMQRLAAAAPEASCLLLGPVDFQQKAVNDDGTEAKADGEPVWVERRRCTAIIEVQRELAAQAGCGFLDAKSMMGGDGSMDAWSTADPALAKSDHLHFTPLGYSHLGRVLSDAVMADYDDPPPR